MAIFTISMGFMSLPRLSSSRSSDMSTASTARAARGRFRAIGRSVLPSVASEHAHLHSIHDTWVCIAHWAMGMFDRI